MFSRKQQIDPISMLDRARRLGKRTVRSDQVCCPDKAETLQGEVLGG